MSNNDLINGIACLDDYRAHAKSVLCEKTWAYISGASADEITRQKNRLKFGELALKSRVLASITHSDTTTKLLGVPHTHPILLAPVAYQELAHKSGESATAQAADAQNTPMIVSTLASQSLESIAKETPQASNWFQLYIQHDLDFTLELVKRAERSNYKAIVLTVDSPVNGLRNREQRIGFTLPNHISPANLATLKPRKVKANESPFEALISKLPTWETAEWLIKNTSLPVIIKGIMCSEDAEKAIQIGAKGIIVSNHGGRSLDTAPATIQVLPEIVKTVNKRVSILLDGGIRRGTDIIKAKALGADAVLIGRPQVYALATAGALGVAQMLRILQDELKLAMLLCGYSNFNDIDESCLYR